MLNFFHGWKRKAGCVTLVMACVFAAWWFRSQHVVDVVGFNEESVMGLAPHTSQLHVTERYRRRDFGHLEVQVTAEDPGTLMKPWTLNMVWDLAPEQEILEYVCAENIRNVHLDWAPTPSGR